MRRFVSLCAAACLLLLAACANMTPTEQRALSGTAIGAAGGAAIGAIAGDAALGAGIGAAAGLAGGLITDKVERDREAAYQRGYYEGRARR